MHWSVIWDYRWVLADGLWLSVQLSVLGIIGSTVLGATVGSLGTMPSFIAKRLVLVFVESMRNLPLILKLFFLHFVIGIDAFLAGVGALILHQSAYIADLTNAGLRSIPSGQTEAATALGHPRYQLFWYILAPQAFRAMIPSLITQYVGVVKNSSVAMLISLQELTFMTQKIEHETFRGFEAATAVTILYVLLTLAIIGPMTALQRALQRPA
jgi:polar amino acid transport system permease protein